MTYPCPCGGVCDCHASSAAFPRPCNLPGGCGSAAAARPDAVSRARAEPSRSPAYATRPRAEPDASAPADLAAVVASLVRPTTHRVVVEGRDPLDGQLQLDHRAVTVRPLLAELRAELVPGGESGGSGRGGGLPLSVNVADVIRDLELLVAGQLTALGIRRRMRSGECEGCSTPAALCRAQLDRLGRRVIGPHPAPCCSRHRHPAPGDRIADGLAQLVPAHWPPDLPDKLTRDAFRDRLAALVESGRVILAGETTGTYVRDTRCPVCLVEWVTEKVPGGADRHPALRVNRAKPEPDGTPGPVRGTTCTACSRRWSWDDMQAPGPPDWQPGKLWQLIAADRTVVAEARAALGRRELELAERDRYAGGSPRDLGLPQDAPVPRSRPADRAMPPRPELSVRDDTAAIREAMTRLERCRERT